MAVLLLLLSVGLIIWLTNTLHVHPFLTLFVVALLYAFLTGMPLPLVIKSINEGFGDTLGKIGLIIVFGVIIGAFLENTGGAYTLAQKVLRVVGKNRVSQVMSIIGYFISIPVFADSGFILLSPLNKSLAKKAGISLAGPAVALGLGLTATHTLVPPTPGPIAAAGILQADLGLVLMLGIPISALSLVVGVIYATRFAAKTWVDPDPEQTVEKISPENKEAPGPVKAAIPVIVPIILIIMKSFLGRGDMQMAGFSGAFIDFIGEPVIALFIGALLCLTLPKKLDATMLSNTGWVGKALLDAATILLITGAGGIFGKVLQNSGIADILGNFLKEVNLSIWLPFILASAIKTAQGSSTVAIITTASIMMPLMSTLGFDTEMQKALVVLAIGAGSAVVSHANDSFFWVFTQMTGMKVKTGYKLFSLGTFILGGTAATLVFISYLFFN